MKTIIQHYIQNVANKIRKKFVKFLIKSNIPLSLLHSAPLESLLLVNLILHFIACRGQFLELNVIPPSSLSVIKFRGVSSTSLESIDSAITPRRSFLLVDVAFIVDVATTKPSFSFNSPRKTDRSPARSRHVISTNGKVISCESYFLSRSQQYVVAGASHCSHCKKCEAGRPYRDRRDNGEIAGRNRELFPDILVMCSFYVPFFKSNVLRIEFTLFSHVALYEIKKFVQGVPRYQISRFFRRKDCTLHFCISNLLEKFHCNV